MAHLVEYYSAYHSNKVLQCHKGNKHQNQNLTEKKKFNRRAISNTPKPNSYFFSALSVFKQIQRYSITQSTVTRVLEFQFIFENRTKEVVFMRQVLIHIYMSLHTYLQTQITYVGLGGKVVMSFIQSQVSVCTHACSY